MNLTDQQSVTPAAASKAAPSGENAYSPKSINDVLYLIAAYHPGVLNAATLRQLSLANLYCVRGDLRSALQVVDQLMIELDESELGHDSVAGFRLFLQSLINDTSDQASTATEAVSATPGVFTTVSQLIESNDQWYQGNLIEGLRLNQIALDSSRSLPSTWLMYATLLLSKKLTDIHIPARALQTVEDLGEHTRISGLQVFESVHLALRSAIELQSGDFETAIQTAQISLDMADERRTTIGLKLAQSVVGYSYVGLRRYPEATAALEQFRDAATDFILPDSIARASFAEVAIVAACDGAPAAADRIRSIWDRLGTASGFFLEDVTRPAWLVATCAGAGDTDLARRALQAVQKLAQKNTQLPVAAVALNLALDAFSDPEHAPATILSGHNSAVLDGYRSKLSAITELPRTIDGTDLENLAVYLSPPPDISPADELSAGARESAGGITRGSLSRRENDVAQLVVRGMTNKQIAKQLGISPHTVNFHLRKIFNKLSISTRAELSSLVAGWSRSRD